MLFGEGFELEVWLERAILVCAEFSQGFGGDDGLPYWWEVSIQAMNELKWFALERSIKGNDSIDCRD